MSTDFTNNNTTISTSGGLQPTTRNTPLDVRTRVNSKADIESIPNPFVGMKIIVLQDETNNNKMTEYVVVSLKANSSGTANSKVNEVVLAKDFLGVNGNGMTNEQVQQLNDAYTHSQSTHVQQSDLPTKTSQLQNDSDFATNASVDEKIADVATGGQVDLTAYAKKTDLPTKTSQLTNDSGFLTEHQNISGKADKSYVDTELAKKSDKTHTHSYNDLSDKPVIPSIDGLATKKELTDGLATKSDTTHTHDQYLTEHQDLSNYALKTEIPSVPTKTSQLTNDSGFITSIPNEYITETELNDKGYLTQHQDISGKANKSEIPTKTSQLQNDSGFITAIPSEYITESELNAKGLATETFVTNKITEAQLGGSGSTVDLSGLGADLSLNGQTLKLKNSSGQEIGTGVTLPQASTIDAYTKTETDEIIQEYTGGKKISSPMTKAEYDAIVDKDPNTIYLVEDEEEDVIVGLPNYTTNDANKILAVNAEGTALAWIDKPTDSSQEVDLTAYAKKTDLPTRTSQLTNDSNFADKSYVAAEISKVSVGGGAVFREPTLREVFTCTVPDNFSDASSIGVYSGNATTGTSIRLSTRVNKCPNTPEVITITTSSNMRSNKSELTFTRTNYHELQSFIVTPLAPGEGTVTITAPTGYSNTAKFNITGEAIEDVEPEAVTLVSINAVYTQGSTVIYPDTSLDTLKSNLVITANYSDSSNRTVSEYSLSGVLTVGTSTVTVAFGGKTTTFSVIVTAKEEEPDIPPVVEGGYATNGLTHMVDFTQYPVGHTGDIIDTVTNQPLVTNGLSYHTTGRIGFVEEGMFSPGNNRSSANDVWAHIPENSMGQLVYPITMEAYVRLRPNYDEYQPDGVKKLETSKQNTIIFNTRDTETVDKQAIGFWLRYTVDTNNFYIIETLNNTTMSTPEGSATELFAYTAEDMVWTHLVVVFGPEDKRIYINGELTASGGGGILAPEKPCCFRFVRFDWKVFRMYNRALTTNEVQNNYNVTISTMGGNQ